MQPKDKQISMQMVSHLIHDQDHHMYYSNREYFFNIFCEQKNNEIAFSMSQYYFWTFTFYITEKGSTMIWNSHHAQAKHQLELNAKI